MNLAELLKMIQNITRRAPTQIHSKSDIPVGVGYIYVVANGNNILQIGKTKPNVKSKGRLPSLLKRSPPSIHNKSFLVGLAEIIFQRNNEYFLFQSDKPEDHEREIHTALNVQTNRDACFFIEGQHMKSIKSAQSLFYDKFLDSPYAKSNFDDTQRNLTQQLFNTVQSGVRFQRSSGEIAKYNSGDVLAGSVLKSAGLIHLAPTWQKMTNNYFQYSAYYNELAKRTDPKIAPKLQVTSRNAVNSASSEPEENDIDRDILYFDTPIQFKLSQFLKAKELLNRRPNDFKTVNFYLESSDKHFVLEIEKPSINSKKLNQIIDDLSGENYIVTEAEKTGRAKPIQYFSDWECCYITIRTRGFQNSGDNYFNYR